MASNSTDVDISGGALTQRRKAKAEELAQAMLNCVQSKGKRKPGKTRPLSEQLLEQATLLRQSVNNSGPQDPLELGKSSLQEILQKVQELDASHRNSSKTRRISEVLQPFVEGLTRYTAVVDTMVQSDPTVSALVWGGAKFILQIAQDYSQHFEALTKLLQQLGPLLNYLGSLSQCFDWSDEITTLIVQSYQTILQILDAVSAEYGQSGLKAVLKGVIMPFGRRQEALKEQLNEHMQQLRDWGQLALGIVQRKQQEDEMQKRIHCWLQAPLGDTIYDQCIKNRCVGTCEWLFKDDIYQKWENFTPTTNSDSRDRFLWLNGPPGIGKTFLAASIIHKLKAQGYVIYYFFREDKSGSPQSGKGEAITFLRHIAMQLVDIIQRYRSHKLPKSFWDIYDQTGRGSCLSDITRAVEVVKVLLNVLPRVHIVVDGLDECIDRYVDVNPLATPDNSRQKLPWILKALCTQYNGVIKWAFTSCIEPQLTTLFSKTLQAPTLTITQGHTGQDVMNFMMDFYEKLDLSREGDPDCFVLGILRCMSMINFLDAKLTMSVLSGQGVTCEEELMDALGAYNIGFNERYLRGLKVVAERPENERELARKILAFVSVAERPLTINELLEGLGATTATPFSSYSSARRPDRLKFEELLSPLLELDATRNVLNPTVRFIHRTAREFLSQSPEKMHDCPKVCESFFMTLPERHLLVGRACLNYICYQRGESTSEDTGDQGPAAMEEALANDERDYAFMKYSCIFWYRHIDNCPGTPELLNCIEEFLCSPQFITSLKVQSLYAPYLLARFTSLEHEERSGYQINNPDEVYTHADLIGLSASLESSYFADPLPGWLANFDERGAKLVHECQVLIQEFGLVLLRHKGGIANFHPRCLGKSHFAKHSCPPQQKWKAIALEGKKSRKGVQGDSASSPGMNRNQHMMTIINGMDSGIVARCLVVNHDELTVTGGDWSIPLNRERTGRRPKAKLLREFSLKYDSGSPTQSFHSPSGSWFNHLGCLSCASSEAETIFTAGPYSDLLCLSLKTNAVSELGCGAPMAVLSEICGDNSCHMQGWVFQDRRSSSSVDGNVIAVAHRWVRLGGGSQCRETARNRTKARPGQTKSRAGRMGRPMPSVHFDSTSDSDSSTSGSSDSDSEPDDSGYSSAGSASHYTSPIDNVCGFSSVAIISREPGQSEVMAKKRWCHYSTTKMPLRQSPPAVHPSGRYVIFPLDSSRTAIVDNVTGKVNELHSKMSAKLHSPLAIIYHFTPPSAANTKTFLHRLTATRDFSQHLRWHVDLDLIDFPDNGDSVDIDGLRTFKEIAKARISWVSPYINPFDLPNHPGLPFSYTWDQTHLNLVFGACEVYVCRIELMPTDQQITEVLPIVSSPVKVSAPPSTNPPTSKGDGSSDSESESEIESESESENNSECSDDEDESESESVDTDLEDTSISSQSLQSLNVYIPQSNQPIFLPASTTRRPFAFHAPMISNIQYALFAIAGTEDLPAVLVLRDLEEDLGGWVRCDAKQRVYLGRGSTADGKRQKHTPENWDMGGKYSCNSLTYNVSIRSGMEWNTRVEVVCGAALL